MMLHPGAAIALKRLTMDELDIARAIVAGELVSPQRYHNLLLIAMRITGTGLAYRTSWKEFVWRDSSLYLTPDFLARCNGLPVIWEHPPKNTLDSKEFSKRVIGSIFLPYLKNDEVWGIAKIHDDEAADALEKEQLSTSPAVVLRDADSTVVKLEDGTPLLIEGKPTLLDHLAVCEQGVWDKQGPPAGVLSETLGERAENMTEEDQKAADAKRRADGNAGIEPDKVLAALDGISKRMDAISKRLDDDDDRRKRDDARRRADAHKFSARKDDDDDDGHRKRRDAEEAELAKHLEESGEKNDDAARLAKDARKHADDDDKRRADAKDRAARHDDDDDARRRRADDDAARCADDDDDDKFRRRMDAEESEEREEREEAGEPEETAADKARRHRADKEKWRADRRRKRADDAAAKERADSIAANAELIARGLANMPKPATDADYAAMADAQSRADSAYQALGQRAPGPLQAETLLGYRVRLARGLQGHSKAWASVDLHTLQDAALAIAEEQIRADAIVASNATDGLPEGRLVPRTRVDPATCHRITEFRGKRTFIHALAPPPMAITQFKTAKGN